MDDQFTRGEIERLEKLVADVRAKNTELEIRNRELRESNSRLLIVSKRPENFAELRTANLKRQKEWDPEGKVLALWRSNELAGEAGELLEAGYAILTEVAIACGRAANTVKKLERERMGIKGSRATVDDLAQELSDVIICADLTAWFFSINLWPSIVRTFNATSDKVGLSVKL